MSGKIETSIVDQVATITLSNEAKRNSMDLPMLEQLRDTASELASNHSLKAVVIRGAGTEAFSAGADFDAIAEPPLVESANRMDAALIAATQALKAIEVPVIAAIRGACFGGALQLALTADIRIASSDSKFGVPAVRVGLAYPLDGISDVVSLIGGGMTALTFLGGLNFDAVEALRRGIVEVVAPVESFDAELDRIVRGIKQSDRGALVAYKAILRALSNGDKSSAERSHRAFAETHAYVPALTAVIEQRRAKKS